MFRLWSNWLRKDLHYDGQVRLLQPRTLPPRCRRPHHSPHQLPPTPTLRLLLRNILRQTIRFTQLKRTSPL